MKKRLSLLLLAIVANMSVIFSQNVQSYQGTQAFNSMIGYISGTEKFSYYVSDKGDKLKHGAYSFSGSKELSNRSNQLNGKYTLNATFAHGELNGSYVVSTAINGKTWSFARGWQSFSGSSKLTGVFAKGKPNGTFTASYNGEMKHSGTATLKDGKYVGAYKYSGPGYKSLWVMNGQLTADGKLTGNWRVENIVKDWHVNYTFLNDVLIGDGSMTPQLQNIAKQYAEGKISKEAVEQKGYIIKTDSLPLDYFIDYLLFLDDDDYGLDKLEGYDFSDFSSKKYTKIVQLNTITDEGFAVLINEIKKSRGYKVRYTIGSDESNYFDTKLDFDRSNNADYLSCGQKFNQRYGSYPVGGHLYLTKKQYDALLATQDSVLIPSAHDFAELVGSERGKLNELGRLYAAYRNNASDLLAQLSPNYSNVYSLYQRSESRYNYLMERLNSATEFNVIRSSKDSTYIIGEATYVDGNNIDYNNYVYAWKNEFAIWEQFNNALYAASLKADSLTIMQNDLLKELNAANISDIQARIIKQYFAQSQNNSKESLQSAYNRIVETQQLVKAAGAIEKEHNYIMANVPDKLLKNYKKEYKSFIKTKDVNSNNQYKSIAKLQKNMIAYYEQLQKAEELNNVINEKKSIYPDILKPWSAKYETNTTLTEDVEKSLADVEDIQNIGQKLLNYIDLRQHCDSAYTEILSTCGKQYGDVSKPYQAKVKGMTFVPDMSSAETLDKEIATLTEYSLYQDELKKYLQNRQKVDQLNQSIIGKIGKAKNVKKLYGVFYKSLPVAWSTEADNFKIIKETISQLQKAEETLQAKGADAFEPQLKKAKTVEDFEKVFEL